jgi:mannose/fructose/N-acetylgalactosamine-specific phosphotransferase system component IID
MTLFVTYICAIPQVIRSLAYDGYTTPREQDRIMHSATRIVVAIASAIGLVVLGALIAVQVIGNFID